MPRRERGPWSRAIVSASECKQDGAASQGARSPPSLCPGSATSVRRNELLRTADALCRPFGARRMSRIDLHGEAVLLVRSCRVPGCERDRRAAPGRACETRQAWPGIDPGSRSVRRATAFRPGRLPATDPLGCRSEPRRKPATPRRPGLPRAWADASSACKKERSLPPGRSHPCSQGARVVSRRAAAPPPRARGGSVPPRRSLPSRPTEPASKRGNCSPTP